jgi:hypothetical protein
MELLIGVEALYPLAARYPGLIRPDVVRAIFRASDGTLVAMIAHGADGNFAVPTYHPWHYNGLIEWVCTDTASGNLAFLEDFPPRSRLSVQRLFHCSISGDEDGNQAMRHYHLLPHLGTSRLLSVLYE